MATLSATVADSSVFGNHRVHMATFTTIADADVYSVPGIRNVVGVFITPKEASAAGDAITPGTVSGSVVTFSVTGTITAAYLLVVGY